MHQADSRVLYALTEADGSVIYAVTEADGNVIDVPTRVTHATRVQPDRG
jgi:hypothetical protein